MPSAKKERSKNRKAAKRAAPPAIEAAAARIKAANVTPELSSGLEAFLSIDLPGGHGAAPPGAISRPARYIHGARYIQPWELGAWDERDRQGALIPVGC